MMNFLGGLLFPQRGEGAGYAYWQAVRVSDDLLNHLRNPAAADEPSRSLFVVLWEKRHNIPFLTSVYETVQEMDLPPKSNGAWRTPPH